jgi:hypothetical protein
MADSGAGRDPLPSEISRPVAPMPKKEQPPAPAPELRGVPLAALAACRSDREEDALKQRLIAAGAGPGQCESAAGRYHMIETKNLNAFLIYVERAPRRAALDRCGELQLALQCLQGRGAPGGGVR